VEWSMILSCIGRSLSEILAIVFTLLLVITAAWVWICNQEKKK
jgi:hypothetical protein